MAQVHLTLNEEILKGLFAGDSEAALKALLTEVLNVVLRGEASEQIGAAAYERSEGRTVYRNGYRERGYTTRLGKLTLQIPKLREGQFTTELFKRYARSEQALLSAMMEMVLQGVSTRNVSEITEQLCGRKFSATTVSTLCKELDPAVEAFRSRPLEGSYRFVCCDAIYMRVHREYRVVSVGLFIAIGVNEEGRREVLGFDTMTAESTSAWKAFFQGLMDRGLHGVELITSDAHGGIKSAIQEKFPGAAWQRCQTHFSRNVLERCPKSLRAEIHRALNDMYNAPDLEGCKARFAAMLTKYGDQAAKAMKVLEDGFFDVISIYALPEAYRKRLRTSNGIERLNEELRRRERALRIFPNEASLLRLMGALLLEQHEQWMTGNRYLPTGDIALSPALGWANERAGTAA